MPQTDSHTERHIKLITSSQNKGGFDVGGFNSNFTLKLFTKLTVKFKSNQKELIIYNFKLEKTTEAPDNMYTHFYQYKS